MNCFLAAEMSHAPSSQPHVLFRSNKNALLKMKQNVSIPFRVVSSKKKPGEDQRAGSLMKRFGVLTWCVFQGVCVSLAGTKARAGGPEVQRGMSSAPAPPLQTSH